jgi:hypothetical protein
MLSPAILPTGKIRVPGWADPTAHPAFTALGASEAWEPGIDARTDRMTGHGLLRHGELEGEWESGYLFDAALRPETRRRSRHVGPRANTRTCP